MVRSRISCFKRRLGFCVCSSPCFSLGTYQTFVFEAKALVEKTGQITSYSATGGEDGDLKKGVKWPNPRFKDNGNGTVTDRPYQIDLVEECQCLWSKNLGTGIIGRKYPGQWFSRPYGRFCRRGIGACQM